MNYQEKCQNMNHGRAQSQVKFCPSCGEKLNSTAPSKCTTEKHSSRRKDRDQFCLDCGQSLKTK